MTAWAKRHRGSAVQMIPGLPPNIDCDSMAMRPPGPTQETIQRLAWSMLRNNGATLIAVNA
jgi:hypothetical protein